MRTDRTRLRLEAQEARDVPAVVFTDTYDWRGATVTMSRLLLGIGLVLGAGVLAAGRGEPPHAPPPRAIPIAELVRQLGSEDFREREAAMKRLSAIRLEPPPELLAATKSENPEVRERALKVVRAMRQNVTPRRLSPDQRATLGQVDQFVAATATWDLKPEDPLSWEPALDIGRRLIKKAAMTGERRLLHCPSSFRDFAAYKAFCTPRLTRVGTMYEKPPNMVRGEVQSNTPEAIQAEGVIAPLGLVYNLVIARGNVEAKGAVQASLVLANGNVSIGAHVSDTIVVCDGGVDVTEFITKSVIVARGNITARQGALTSVLIAGGKVMLGRERTTRDHRFNAITEKAVKPLGYITFFELATVGVEAKFVGKAVQVSSVAAEKPFADAGVKVGDIVVEVNGKSPDSPESLRRLLRDALAIGDATVKLQRGDTIVTAKVTLPE